MIGCMVGAVVIAPVLNMLYQAYGFPGALPREGMDPSAALAAPQAALMTTIAKGIFSSSLPWEYIYMGMGLGVLLVAVASRRWWSVISADGCRGVSIVMFRSRCTAKPTS